MGRLTPWVVAEAEVTVRRMSHDQKVRLADEIYAQQPTMLASILALPRMGVDMAQLEVVVHILLVTFQAMKLSGHQWPLVTEDIQDGCLQRLTASARFTEGLPQELATKVVEQFHNEHADRFTQYHRHAQHWQDQHQARHTSHRATDKDHQHGE